MADDEEMYDSLSDLRVVDKARPIWLHGASNQDPLSSSWKADAAGSRSSMSRTYGGQGAHDRARASDRSSRDSSGDATGSGQSAAARSRRAPPSVSTAGVGAADGPPSPIPKASLSPTTGGHHEPHSLLLTFAGATATSSKPAGGGGGGGGGGTRRRNRAASIPSAGTSPRGHGMEQPGGGGGYKEQVKDSWDSLTHFTNRQVALVRL
jgi:hypothetical protein